MAIIHLGCSSPNSSSDLPENVVRIAPNNEREAQKTFSYLVLHHEEFTRPHLLPDAPVRSYIKFLRTAPFHPSPTETTNSLKKRIGWSIFCCTCRHRIKNPAPGRYPARCPTVFGLSSFVQKAIARLVQFARQHNLTKQCWTNPIIFKL
jgi:hypothetical protein